MSEQICQVAACERPAYCRGYCHAHYSRVRSGRPLDPPLRVMRWGSPIERILAQIDTSDPFCWEWSGTLDRHGYGRTSSGAGRMVFVHRVTYEYFRGPIPEGLVIDHLCRNRRCCNPAHLEPVTLQENKDRGVGIHVLNAAKTHCPHGHPYTPENTYLTKGGRARECRTCKLDRERRVRARRRVVEAMLA